MPATQNFLQFDHIRNGVVVLHNGDLRALLMVSAVNFGLKSQEEQDALTYAFQNFLNSLDFDLQIFIHSRKMNIGPYLHDLQTRADAQENELLRQQTEEYIEFIKTFVASTNVMTKQFYIVVPFSFLKTQQHSGGVKSSLPAFFSPRTQMVRMTDAQFSAARTQLLQRVEFVSQNLNSLGLRSTILTTEEILELFWRLYNPEKQEAGGMPEIPQEALTGSQETFGT